MAKFYICKKCGNLAGMIKKTACTPTCCGETMSLLEPNTTDAAVEKHVPEIAVDGDTVTVTVSSVTHPMTEKHLIEWIYIETEKGGQRKILTADDEPKAVFKLADDKLVAAYAYCNLHGLWKKEA